MRRERFRHDVGYLMRVLVYVMLLTRRYGFLGGRPEKSGGLDLLTLSGRLESWSPKKLFGK
jgi:hypothetical protein